MATQTKIGGPGQWSDRWFRSLVEQSLAGIYVVQDGRFVYVNQKLAELFGYRVEEVYHLGSVDALVAPPDRALVRENIRRRVAGEVESLRYCFRGRRKDGAHIEVEVHGSRTRVDGRPAVVGLLLDVTERRRAERDRERLYREAQDAIRARERVLAVVSHDLRNPLNAILMATQLLRMAQQAEVQQRPLELVDRIERLAGQMSVLIEDLVDASALEAGSLSLEVHTHDAREIFDAALAVLEPLALEKGVELTVEATPVALEVDRDRLVQVLSNLGGNAIRFTPTGGRVTLRVTAEEGGVRFAVEDTGPGIPAEDRAHVFERFWKAEGPGAGLGLAIARGIVEAHGGRIWVASREGQGTSFQFTLPRSATGRAAARGPGPAGDRSDRAERHVEADHGLREALRELRAEHG